MIMESKYQSYQELLEDYSRGGLINSEASDMLIGFVTENNVEEIVHAIPEQMAPTFWRYVAYAPTTELGWSKVRHVSLGTDGYRTSQIPVSAGHPYRDGIETLRNFICGKFQRKI